MCFLLFKLLIFDTSIIVIIDFYVISALQVKLLRKHSFDTRVVGVTQLDNKIYVTLQQSTSLLTYDTVSFVKLGDVELILEDGEPIDILAIAACSRNHCMYATDRNNLCTLRLTNEGRTVINWLDKYAPVRYSNVYKHGGSESSCHYNITFSNHKQIFIQLHILLLE